MATKLQAALIAVAEGQTPDLTRMSAEDKDLVNGLVTRTARTRPVDGTLPGQGESLIKIKTEFSPKQNGVKGDWLCCYYRLSDHPGEIHPRADGREARSAVLYGATRNNLITVGAYQKHDVFMSVYVGRKLKASGTTRSAAEQGFRNA